ncbi:glycosyltransferase family 4 protein [Chthonobacter rhizosphaerae]|uniref:glycosyltransferase family 4 protein n=1 Tax=Chthonobacter rhizosphaerae TaxID=2735553 RepID=UPI0015EFB927|nr:glycosyltransferase family 4 protein [Chthonobacter rhizosphaerae]
MPRVDFAATDVVAPNLNRRYSGVTSTVIALLPTQARAHRIAGLGPNLPDHLPTVGWRDVLRGGWTPPPGRRARIWHARRNIEMVWGLVLARVLRQPWRLVFTSAAQRRHTGFTKALIRRMDAVIATSPEAASYLQVPAVVSLHGVDTAVYRPADDRSAAWAATGLPGRFGVGIFGRVRPQKGTDIFVEALLATLPSRPDWTAVVIGLEKPEDRAFADALRNRLDGAGLEGRVRFLGERPVAEIPGWYRALSLVVAPPRKEGFGLIPLEAMASATPVIASRAGAHVHLVEDCVTGWLVDAGDATALASALSKAMDLTPAERDALGRAGRARVEAAFSIEREAERIAAVYAGLDTLRQP